MADPAWTPALADRGGPLYRALADAICDDVEGGALAAGTRLPPVRDLAWRIGISPGAVARAYRVATERGALEAAVGRGTFVREAFMREGENARPTAFEFLLEPTAAQPRSGALIDLRGNQAVDVGQSADITAALQRMIAAAEGALPLCRYRHGGDDEDCYAAIAAWLRAGGAPAEPDALVVTTGAQTGVMLALSAALRGGSGGALALCESVVHPGLKDTADAVGARLEPVETDEEGVLPDALDAACARLRPSALMLTATLHNPTLAIMGPERRAAVVEIARRRDIAIVEDDVYGWLLEDRPTPFAGLAPERSFYVSSFSKSVAAGLRAGFVLSPPDRAGLTRRLHQAVLHHTPWLVTGLAAELARSGDADRIRARVRAETRRRAEMLERALSRFGARTHPAASFAFLPTPPPWTSAEFAAAAAAAGAPVAPRAAYAVGRAPAEPDFVRVAAGAVSRADLAEGLARLVGVLEDGRCCRIT